MGNTTPIRITPGSIVGITPESVVGIAPASVVGVPSVAVPGTTVPSTQRVEGTEEGLGRERGQGRGAGNGGGQRETLVPGHLFLRIVSSSADPRHQWSARALT